MAASAEYKPARGRIERLESLLKKIRAMAAAALANTSTFHAPVVAVATVNIAALAAPQVIDGVATVAGDRVLLANQAVPSQNGIWIVQAGAWIRPSDWASGSTRVVGETVTVADGGTTFPRFGNTWMMTTAAVVDAAGGTPIFFPRFEKGSGVLDIALADRWIFAGAVGTASDTTVGAVAAVNVTAVTPGAGFGQGNGTLTIDGTDGHTVSWVVVNF